METFGQYLKNEREKLGLKVEEIAEVTRIGKQILFDLENDDYEKLPHDTFVRGFLRSIARELKIDQAELVLKYKNYREGLALGDISGANDKTGGWRRKRHQPAAGSQIACDSQPSDGDSFDEATASTTSGTSSNKLTPDYTKYLLTFLIFAAVVSVVALLLTNSNVDTSEQIYLNDIGHVPDSNPTVSTHDPAQISPSAATGASDTDERHNAEPPPADTPVESVPAPGEASIPPAPAIDRTITGNILVKSVRGSSWVGYTIDGGEMSDVTLPQGQTIRLEAHNQFKLQIGNAAAVRVVLNGRDLGPLGNEGEVRVLELNARDGLNDNRAPSGG